MQGNNYDVILFLLTASAIIVFLGGFILAILFAHGKHQMAHEKKLEILKSDFESANLKAQIETQEETLNQISREIHDNINLSLTLAKLHLVTLAETKAQVRIQKIQETTELLGKAIADLNHISRGLDANVLLYQGLHRAVEEETERIRKTGVLDLKLKVAGTPLYMDNQRELLVYRTIQEALNNVIKHAKARHCTLQLNYGNEQLEVIITDDGCGFETEAAENSGRAGLKNMRNRIKMLGGRLDIQAANGYGTQLHFTAPYKPLSHESQSENQGRPGG